MAATFELLKDSRRERLDHLEAREKLKTWEKRRSLPGRVECFSDSFLGYLN
jgi:hypothetical protein